MLGQRLIELRYIWQHMRVIIRWYNCYLAMGQMLIAEIWYNNKMWITYLLIFGLQLIRAILTVKNDSTTLGSRT